jgi:hypothetical protein
MNVRFLPPAEQELDDAYQWYEDQMSGLGRAFLAEINEAVHRVTTWPEAHTVLRGVLRRCLIRQFPYGLIYGVDGQTIVIVAVAHLHRKPFYWTRRV